MRLVRLVPLALLVLPLMLAPGCSRRVEKLVGSARLIRGTPGLGTTIRTSLFADRDTYVDPGTRSVGGAILVGQLSGYDARALLKVARWSLPDTTDGTLVVEQVKLVLPRDSLRTAFGIKLELSRTAADWDTSTVVHPGPGPLEILGSAGDSLAGIAFEIPLVAGSFAQVKEWARNPAAVPGFLVRSIQGQGVAAYRAGQIRFRILYRHTVSGSTVSDSIDSPVTQNFYLHTAVSPEPVGTEVELPVGGLNETWAAFHFAPPAVVAGSSINEATLVLRIRAGSQVFAAGQFVDVDVRRIGAPWSEAVTRLDSLQVSTDPVVTRFAFAVGSAADSLITIALPSGLVRDWSDLPGANLGIAVSLRRGNVAPEILLGSRESDSRPELRFSTTTPPPARF